MDDMRDALRRAESFGDIFGIIVAQWGYGTVLLRAERRHATRRSHMLERARAGILKHRMDRRAGHHRSRSGHRRRPKRPAGRRNR